MFILPAYSLAIRATYILEGAAFFLFSSYSYMCASQLTIQVSPLDGVLKLEIFLYTIAI